MPIAFRSRLALLAPRCVALLAVAAVAAAAACGSPGGVARAVGPDAPTYSKAAGLDASCDPVSKEAAPFLVDWRPEQRADLEAAMRQSIAVVSYDCHTIKVLDACTIEGTYGFVGVTQREQVIRLESADEIRANLPLSGFKIGGGLQAELERGTTLDVALSIVGKRVAARHAIARADLKGSCDGATHFVRTALLGAFAMQTGTKAKVRTAAEIFGAKVEGGSSNAAATANRDGDLAACKASTPDAPSPDPRCGAPLRLELTALVADATAKPTDAALASTCPNGFVLMAGKCARPSDAAPHRCAYGDLPDCVKQCDRGDVGSCVFLGDMHRTGERAPRDPKRARELFQRACDKDDALGCSALGSLLYNGEGVDKDRKAAAALFQRACDAGNAGACGNLGRLYFLGNGVDKDKTRGLALLARACEGGDARSCEVSGGIYAIGAEGTPRDLAKGRALLTRGCEGGSWRGCHNLGILYFYGLGVAADASRAAILFQSACDHDEQAACVDLGIAYELGRGAAKDVKRAETLYMDACAMKAKVGCASYALRMEIAGTHKPAFVRETYERACGGDLKKCALVDEMQRDCELGELRSCTLAGAIVRQTDKKAAAALLARGCAESAELHDDAACALAKVK